MERQRAQPVRDDRAIERLVNENVKLAHSATHRFMKRCGLADGEYEDLLSYALIGLFRAAQAWQPEKSQFSTLAFVVMTRAMIRGYNFEKRGKELNPISLDASMDPDGDMTLESCVSDDSEVEPEHIVLERLEVDEIKRQLRGISSEAAAIADQYFFEGYSFGEIGQDSGVTRQAIQAQFRRAARQTRKRLHSWS